MTGVLSVLLQADENVVFAIGLSLIVALVLYGVYGAITNRTVPANKIVVISRRDNDRRKRIVLPGQFYHPSSGHTSKYYDREYVLLPITHVIGKHAVTWKIDEAKFEQYLDCPLTAPRRYGDDHAPIPIRNLQWIFQMNPEINFADYAGEYGIVILKIEPPLLAPVPPKPRAEGLIGICYCHNATVGLSYEERKSHFYIAGKTKSGKSTLLYNLALQDIKAGRGVAFIDPHGDTARRLFSAIPKNRTQDMVFLSGTHPIPLGIMQAASDAEAEILAEDIYTLLRGMSDTWGDRMDAILRNTLSALFSAQGCSFLDIYNFLADPAIRQEILSRVDNRAIRRFWENYRPPNYPRGSEQPILSRMEKFVTGPTLSKILGSESGIDLYEMMQTGKILLVDTSRRSMGEQTGAVLGGLIVTKFYQSAMRRAEIAEAERSPFYLYIDEFQRFIASPLGSMLSETRKYGLSLTLAHQFLGQIPDETRKAIFGNVGTMAFFQMGYDDAKYLAHQLGSYSVESLLDLSMENHEAIVRPATGAARSYKIRTLAPEEPPAGGAALPLPPPPAAAANKRTPHDRDADPEPTPLPENSDR